MAKLEVAACDYYRATAPTEQAWGEWHGIFLAQQLKEKLAGRKERVQWLMGYYGIKTEHMFGGVGEQGTLLQFSGQAADQHWIAARRVMQHTARLDLQVTLPMGPKQSDYIEACYHEAAGALKRAGRPIEPQMSIRPSGARMVTFGSRSSAIYGRVYDKEKESGKEDFAGCVRWEVEYHNDAAGDVCDYLQGREYNRGVTALLVREQFAQWGVTRQWDRDVGFDAPAMGKGKRTFETREAWLATQVSQTLKYLVENGHETQAASALLTAFGRIAVDDIRLRQLSKLLRMCILEGV